jgi:hypothetical protein
MLITKSIQSKPTKPNLDAESTIVVSHVFLLLWLAAALGHVVQDDPATVDRVHSWAQDLKRIAPPELEMRDSDDGVLVFSGVLPLTFHERTNHHYRS